MFSYDEIRDKLNDAIDEVIDNYRSEYGMLTADFITMSDGYEDTIDNLAVMIRDALNDDFCVRISQNNKDAEATTYGFTAEMIINKISTAMIKSNNYDVAHNGIVEMVETALGYDDGDIITINCDILTPSRGLCHHQIIVLPSHSIIMIDDELAEFCDIDNIVGGWLI